MLRFQTRNSVQRAAYTGGPQTNPAKIVDGDYYPTWGMSKVDVVMSMKLFMNVSITTINAIPTNGEVKVTFSETVNSTPWGGVTCYYIDPITETVAGTTYVAACSATADRVVTIPNMPSRPAASKLFFRVYSEF